MAAPTARPDTWKTLGKLVAALVAAGVLVAGLALPYVGGLGLVAGKQADKFQDTRCDLRESKPPQRTTLYAKDGKTVLATLFKQNRVEIGLDQVPQDLQDALVATEDRRFYSHHGVDMRGLIRSAVNTTNGDTQGGSTLTMQYVKQVRYYEAGDDPKKQQAAIVQNLNRKIEDAKCAIYIEESLKESKKEILQNYLNIAFFGQNSYGIQTAARTYFNKSASQLNPQESALLVGMLRAPSAYDPFTNRVAATERRNEVLQNMVAVGKYTQAQADKYKATPIQLASDGPPPVRQGCASADTTVKNVGFFCDYVQNWLSNVAGISPQEQETGGYRIITTLDPKLQSSAQTNITKAVPAKSAYTAVLPVIEPRTGNILAMASSKQFGLGKNETEQPLFTQRTAAAASTYKLFPLLAALQTGVPMDYALNTSNVANGEDYKPENCLTSKPNAKNDSNRQFSRNQDIRDATVESSNTYFVALADQFFSCSLQPMVDVATKLGVKALDVKVSSKETVGQYVVSKGQALRYTLGSVETSPLEMAGAYAGIANGGKFNAPAPVSMVYDSDGNAIDTKRSPAVQAVPEQTAYRAVDILSGETKGEGTSADRFDNYYNDGGSDIAGKTGTALAVPSDKNGAVWFVGMTPDLVAASAVLDYNSPNRPNTGLPGEKRGEAYGDFAAKVWLTSLGSTLKGKNWTWQDPAEVEGKDVPELTGLSENDARTELQAAGFKMASISDGGSVLCPSSVPLQKIGFYGPKKATPGTTITVCQSSGVPSQLYAPPAPPPTRRSGGATRSGGTSSAPSGGRNTPAPPRNTPPRGGGNSTNPPGNR